MEPTDQIRARVEALGAQILAERTAAGLSQEALAEILGIHTNTLRKYEKGQRDIPYGTVERIAEALGMRVSNLVLLAEERLDRTTSPS